MPRQLPSTNGVPATSLDARSTEHFNDVEFAGTAWKTKMALERLELGAANSSMERLMLEAFQNRVSESDFALPSLARGVTCVSDSDSGKDVRSLGSSRATAFARGARVLINRAMIECKSGGWLSAESNM